MKNAGRYILLLLKGMCMGAADVVPGVSGGTIALVTGIYEELIRSLSSINVNVMRDLLRLKIRSVWMKINGTFLLAVFTGVLISVFSLARLLKMLMEASPVLLWSFFFGLIIASGILVAAKVDKWKADNITALVAGLLIMLMITRFTPAETGNAYWYIFVCGAVAICAMILPGISGAFILLIMGKYRFILDAVSNLNLVVLAVFGAGVIVGLLSFSKLLGWLLQRFYNITISLLTGFIFGSLYKIWPWKETLLEAADSHGNMVPVIQKSILPFEFAEISGSDPLLLQAVLLMMAGLAVVYILHKLGKAKNL